MRRVSRDFIHDLESRPRQAHSVSRRERVCSPLFLDQDVYLNATNLVCDKHRSMFIRSNHTLPLNQSIQMWRNNTGTWYRRARSRCTGNLRQRERAHFFVFVNHCRKSYRSHTPNNHPSTASCLRTLATHLELNHRAMLRICGFQIRSPIINKEEGQQASEPNCEQDYAHGSFQTRMS